METGYTWRFIVGLSVTWAVLVFLLLPIFVTIPFSLSPQRYLSLPEGGLSLRHYENLVTNFQEEGITFGE